jgi:hypothetical protein
MMSVVSITYKQGEGGGYGPESDPSLQNAAKGSEQKYILVKP